jgi:hypothetical protein
MSTEDLVKDALKKSLSYQEYVDASEQNALNGNYSGNDDNPALAEFTALNYKRMKRLNKTIKIDPDSTHFLMGIKKNMQWIVLTEDWCGDAAQIIPVLFKISQIMPAVNFRLAYRDEHPELMDQFLTNGGKAIPKLLVVDSQSHQIIADWGPRPDTATQMVQREKQSKGSLSPEFKTTLQQWYNHDKGKSVVADIVKLMRSLAF